MRDHRWADWKPSTRVTLRHDGRGFLDVDLSRKRFLFRFLRREMAQLGERRPLDSESGAMGQSFCPVFFKSGGWSPSLWPRVSKPISTFRRGFTMFNTLTRSSLLFAFLLVLPVTAATTSTVDACDACGAPAPVCCAPVCCPPPVKNVSQTLCLYDPCTCKTAKAEVCIPETCCGETPCVTWKSGIFGRRIATVTWEGCCTSVEVVVTIFGKVIVR